MSALSAKRLRSSHRQDVEIEEREDGYLDAIIVPQNDGSGISDSDSEFEDLQISDNEISNINYRQISSNYQEDQSKLEPNHTYVWKSGEKKYENYPEDENLLSENTKKFIRESSYVQLFELFFSTDLKKYIIESTRINGYDLTSNDLDIFVGIIIVSIFNQRKSQKDYWSERPLLACSTVAKAMSRNKFLEIKSKLKFSKPEDQNHDDRAWRVRSIFEIFKRNILQFEFFSIALSIDEMMVKFHGKTVLLQFMKDKPARFGIKM